MKKERIVCDTHLDGLIDVLRQLSTFELRHHMSSEEFFDKYKKGSFDDTVDFVEWAGYYRHFMVMRQELESVIRHAA